MLAKLTFIYILLSCYLACNSHIENHDKKESVAAHTVVDTAYYNFDYRLQANQSYTLSFLHKLVVDSKQEPLKDKVKKTQLKDDDYLTITTEYYSIKTEEKRDTIRLTMTYDSTFYAGKSYPGLKKNKPKFAKGSSSDGKEISLIGKFWGKWPSRKVWEKQENLPRGKFKVGETYTYYSPDYNKIHRADTIVYQLKNVKDSIAYFEVAPRTILKDKSTVNVTELLEYDLRNNYYRKAVRQEEFKNKIDLGEDTFVIEKLERKEYTIGLVDSSDPE